MAVELYDAVDVVVAVENRFICRKCRQCRADIWPVGGKIGSKFGNGKGAFYARIAKIHVFKAHNTQALTGKVANVRNIAVATS
jgi:hypothetical protein